MKKKILILFLIFTITDASASIKDKIIQNLKNVNNLVFNFEQNINGKTENGSCILSYPKKIFCEYDVFNKKILVSNGNSLVIKTKNSYYLYPQEINLRAKSTFGNACKQNSGPHQGKHPSLHKQPSFLSNGPAQSTLHMKEPMV